MALEEGDALIEAVELMDDVEDTVLEGVGPVVSTGIVWMVDPSRAAEPTADPTPFRKVIVAPVRCAPRVAPDVRGNRLNTTALVRLYTPPRSTVHQPVPSHTEEDTMLEVAAALSMSMMPSTPMPDEIDALCVEEEVFLPRATLT